MPDQTALPERHTVRAETDTPPVAPNVHAVARASRDSATPDPIPTLVKRALHAKETT
jgi:hypothetical protein